jgi:glycosyltransferase involved in cell wall biosynthesis
VKLVLSVESLSENLTGIGRYTWELAQRLPLHAMLHDVLFYRNGRWVTKPADLVHPGAKLSGSAKTKARFRLKQPRWLREARNRMACRGKVFHGPNFFLPACAEVGVATVHDLSVFKYPETHPAERIRQFERDFKASMARAAHLITDSEATRQEVIDFLAWPGEKITAVPLGASSQFAPKTAEVLVPGLNKYGLTPKGYTLCVSTLEPRKKIANLLQAYQCLPQSLREQYPLVLIGDTGWLSEALHREIDRLAGRGWLHYLGFVPEADLPLLYAGARSFVYPSVYEGFGLPVLEAMASGVPVVASIFSSLPELTQGSALLLNPEDVDALARGIHTSLCNDDWRANAIDAGLAVAQTYSWDRCVEQTVAVYQKINC